MKTLLMGEKAKGRTLGMDLDVPRIDFRQLAQAMGIHGQRVERPEELGEALRSALDLKKPSLVEVWVESNL
jgi:pyruvate dehydrogenase (quinone)